MTFLISSFLSFDLCLVFLFDDFVLWLLAPFLGIGLICILKKIIPVTIQIRKSPLRTATLLCPLQTLLHTSFVEFIRLLKGVWSKVRKGRSKVAVLYRLCLICIVNTIRIQFLKSKSIILSTHYNKIEFWTLPIRSRRSSKHIWNLYYLLPQPIPTKHA